MATTINRFTWDDDSGTPSAPNHDGTTINNSELQAIFDEVDAILAGDLTIGGLLGAEGVGSHAISGGGTGGNTLTIRNTTAGTGNFARLALGNDASASAGYLQQTSSTFTTAGGLVQDALILDGGRAGGVSIIASHAAGDVRLYTGGVSGLRLTVDRDGFFGFNTAPSANDLYRFGGTLTPGAATGSLVRINGTVNATANQSAVGVTINPTLVEAGSGTHGFMIGTEVDPPTITDNAAATTNAVNLFVGGAPSVGTNRYAVYVSGGNSYFGGPILAADGSASGPAFAFLSESNTGLYRAGSGSIGVTVGGVARLTVTAGANANSAVLVGGLFGSGQEGARLSVQANSSGSGAPGTLVLSDRGATIRPIWSDNTGVLRIGTTVPTETSGDTGGTVVGTQTSRTATKQDITPFEDHAAALALILGTPLHSFTYRGGAYNGTRFLGILAEDAPDLVMDPETPGGLGRSFNPISAFGYLAGSVKALAARLATLEDRSR